MLETIFYLPSAMLLLFGAADLGLRWLEQAAIDGALRAGLRETSARCEDVWRERAALEPQEVVAFAHAKIGERIAAAKSGAVGQEQALFELRVEILRLEVDAAGVPVRINRIQTLASEGPAALSRSAEFIRRTVEEFPARLLMPKLSFEAQRGYALRYAETLLLLYVRAHTETRGLNASFMRGALGAALTADVEELLLIVDDDRN